MQLSICHHLPSDCFFCVCSLWFQVKVVKSSQFIFKFSYYRGTINSESPDIYLLNYTGFPHSHCDQLYLEQYMNYTESSEYLTGESNGDGSLTSCLVGCLNSYDCIGLSFSDRTVRKNGRCGLVAWYCPPEKLKSVPGYHYYVKKGGSTYL